VNSSEQSAGRRLGVATIDQIISGASNFLIALLAAQVLGVAAFGLFGIIMLVNVVVQGGARALISEPLLLHPEEAENRPGDVIGSACSLGLGIGALLVASGLAARPFDSHLGDALIVLGLFSPLLVLQDMGRYLGFATRRPALALTLDVTWLVLQIGAIAALIVLDVTSLRAFVAVWAGSGAVAGLLVFWQHRSARVRPGIAWLKQTWGYSWRYLVSYTSTQGSGLLGAILIRAIAGARALGGVQGALLLMRPFTTLQVAVIASGTGEITRVADDLPRVRRMVRKLTLLTGGAAFLNGAVLVLVPESAGAAVLGDTWSVAQHLMWPAAAQIVVLGLMTGYRTGMLGMRAIDKAVKIDVFTTVLALILSTAGAFAGGAKPAMWGAAMASTIGLVIWVVVFQRHSTRDLSQAPINAT
jgi:O-antigen/teichoic acid export membrane protein